VSLSGHKTSKAAARNKPRARKLGLSERQNEFSRIVAAIENPTEAKYICLGLTYPTTRAKPVVNTHHSGPENTSGLAADLSVLGDILKRINIELTPMAAIMAATTRGWKRCARVIVGVPLNSITRYSVWSMAYWPSEPLARLVSRRTLGIIIYRKTRYETETNPTSK
jgi:hypothetical protein